MLNKTQPLLPGITAALVMTLAGAALASPGGRHAGPPRTAQGKPVVCPVTKQPVGAMGKPIALKVNDTTVKFCCGACPNQFKANPAKFLTTALKDPVTHKPFKVTAQSPKEERGGALYVFSSAETQDEFNAHPEKYTGGKKA